MALNTHPQEVHVDVHLTSMSLRFAQEQNYLAPRIFPVIDVAHQSDKYYVFDAAEENREYEDFVKKAAPRTLPNNLEVTQSDSSYFAELYFAGFDMQADVEANEDEILRTRERKARLVMDQMLKKRDRDFISTFMGTGIWGEDIQGGSGNDFTKWSDSANATPIDDVMKWKDDFEVRNYGMMPNKVVLTKDIKRHLLSSAQILGRINGGATVANPAMVNDSIIASIFEVDEIVYADAVSNKTNTGETAARMVTNRMLMVHTPSDVGIDTPASGMIFAYNAVPGYEWGITMESFTGDYLAEAGLTERVQAKMSYDMKVTGSKLGTYIYDVV